MSINIKEAKTIFETITPYKVVNIEEFTTAKYKDN